jgi:predicted helicase
VSKAVEAFIKKVIAISKSGVATEHSYRPALAALLSSIAKNVDALNEPKRVACGAPDFIVRRGDVTVGHVEAKDLNVALRGMKDANKKQQDRYKRALPNLIYTNCLDWDFYRNGELFSTVRIAHFDTIISPITEKFSELEHLLQEFIAQKPQSITSPKVLAGMMAGKANLIKDVLRNALIADGTKTTALTEQYGAFQEHLIHDISKDDFADIYAETIAYGMFAARLHDVSSKTFSRQEALVLLPKSNPFLRSLFGYLAGVDLDERIAWIIDDMADVFQSVNVSKIMAGFGKLTGQNDPFLHFYETFLAAYNPAKRKARGVWYTPEPIVKFIVRAVDEVLQKELGLADGLADTSKVVIDWDTGQKDKKGKSIKTKKAIHRLQILDPATGTGTFLAEVIKQIAPKVKDLAPSLWSRYVERDLIPRLHGFEILMASYAMCHMKLDMILTELGYKPTGTPPRLSVYLTNSLEEGDAANQTLPFAQWLTNEVRQANAIKRDMPIMCIIGNPPYLGEGGKSEGWLAPLMDDYKKEPGGKVKLKEKNSKWINDLYVKFIRMSSHLIEKNGEGVLGFITNHGYLDNPTFRGMRWHLLNTFDKIWILDLHGNSKKKEVAPNGEVDKNVFDIQQGVSIILAVKRKDSKPGLATVLQGELWGDRASKYATLSKKKISSSIFSPLVPAAPSYSLARRDLSASAQYSQGILLSELMPLHGNGIVTKRDKLNVHHSAEEVVAMTADILSLSEPEFRMKYRLKTDVRDWCYAWARKDVEDCGNDIPVQVIGYRLFDNRHIFYSGRARGLVGWPVYQIMRHYIAGPNIGLLTSKAHRDAQFAHAFVTDKPTEAIHFSATTGSNAMNFPLYIYPEEDEFEQDRRPNFAPEHLKRFKSLAKHPTHGEPNELQVFDYIYGVLHSTTYRSHYAELLKQDFPRIPLPMSSDEFWKISRKGAELRKLHLMDASGNGGAAFTFKGKGNNDVTQYTHEGKKVWINNDQYFDNVEPEAWEFRIGGYQPAQKWLKDRVGRELTVEDVKHYQRIVAVLTQSKKLMDTIALTLP